MRNYSLFFFVFALAVPSAAQRSLISTTAADDCDTALRLLEQTGTPTSATKLPLSHFGVGIGADSKSGGPDRISDAAVVNGKITTLDDDNVIMGPILEAHALVFTIRNDWAVRDDVGRLFVTQNQPCKSASEFPTIATGPFTMLRLGDKEVIRSFGIGWMVGFRLKQSENSLNIGVAYTLQQDVKAYASGFEEGNALPTGEQAIRYRTTDGEGVAFVVSFGW